MSESTATESPPKSNVESPPLVEEPSGRPTTPRSEDRPDWPRTVVVLLVVMVVAGAGTYVGLTALQTNEKTLIKHPSSCLGCPGLLPVHDLSVWSPYTYTEAQTPVQFSATAPVLLSSTTFYFGDGTNETVAGATVSVSHTYTSPGMYFVYARAVDTSGNIHDNLDHIFPIQVAASFISIQSGETALVTGTNTTNASVAAGGSVTLVGEVQAPPSTQGWKIAQVGFVSLSPQVTLTQSSFNNTTVTATTQARLSSAAPDGIYSVVFATETIDGALTAWGNYTFSIGCGVVVARPSSSTSPHPGVADVYYLEPGGSFSEDPSVDYESVGAEPIFNVFQTLITPNGSLVGPAPQDYVPDLATCVPGSNACTQLYGNDLVSGDNYTFVIDPNAEFYNPHTGGAANVFPIDVLFSLARTCLFATWPSYETNPGWIECQSLLPPAPSSANVWPTGLQANASWDSGMHAPLNSTPANILNAIIMNDTAYCPSSALRAAGCVTFDTQYSGHYWPDFLEFISDTEGAGIMECKYAASVGNTLSGLSCADPTDPSAPGPTAWDPVQEGLASPLGDYEGTSTSPIAAWANTLRWDMVGSGPYYLASLTPGTSYTVKANPDWTGTACHWQGCLPVTFTLNTVNVIWESSAVQGETAFENGQVDIVTIPPTDYASVLLPLIKEGKASITSAPTLNIFFTNFDQAFSQSGAQSLLPAGTTLNAPSDLFQDLAFRQFLIHAFPYATVQREYNTVDGIPLNTLYGGVIPVGMANYYPQNISWDLQDPSSAISSPADAGYWWNLVQSEPGGIAAKACLSSKPCVFPFLSQAGAPLQDEVNEAWASEITSLSNGAVNMVPVDIPFVNLVINSFSPPGTNPMPMYELGWAPDYPDPTDYIEPMYASDGTYTYGDALCEAWIGTGCTGSDEAAENYDLPCNGSWVWANASVTMSCQGTAYAEMQNLIQEAAFDQNLGQRAFLYNEMEHIAQQLGIFVPNPGQGIGQWITASWIDGASLNENPTGGNGWYTVQYA